MHKKLAADLTSLAHSILQLKNKEDVLVLKEKAHEIYEKLAVLAYVEEYINTTPNATVTKEELINKIEKASMVINEPLKEIEIPKVIHALEEEGIIGDLEEEETQMTDAADDFADAVIGDIEKDKENTYLEQPFEELEKLFNTNNSFKDDAKDVGGISKIPTLEEELQDTVSVDDVVNLFEKAEKKTLNDQLFGDIQIGLNDRIAFVKHLFDNNQGDFNRVVSQLNTLKTNKEAKKFINKMVKPDYNWTGKEEYETRLIEIIERRFS